MIMPGGHHLSDQAIDSVRRIVEGRFGVVDIGERGEVHFIRAPLPDGLVLSVVREREGGPLWIILDADQADTRKHLRALLEHWPTEVFDEDIATVALGFHQTCDQALDAALAQEAQEAEWEDDSPPGFTS